MNRKETMDALEKLEKMIDRTTEIFNEIVDHQGKPIALKDQSDTQYLCMVRQKDEYNRCRGILWKKYRATKNGRIWIAGWSVERTPIASLTKYMDSDREIVFHEMHGLAKATHKVRRELMSKRKRIKATVQAINDFEQRHMSKLEELRCEIFIN